MNDKLLKKLSFISQILMVFSITVLVISIFGAILGDSAIGESSFFELGRLGIRYKTLWQMLIASTIIIIIKTFVFSGRIFSHMMAIWKSVIMILATMVAIVAFVYLFEWFPVDSASAWVSFFVTYGVCFLISTVVMIVKTQNENQLYDKLLSEYKNKQGSEKDE